MTLVSSNPKVSQTGQLTLTATVTGGQNLAGTITFYDYGSAIAGAFSVTEANPSIQIGTDYLFVGVHQITAKYSGDANNLPSTSAAVMQTITGTTSVTVQGTTGSDSHVIQATLGLQ